MSVMQGQKTQGLEFFSGALSFQNLREISRLIGRDLKGLHQDEMQKFEKVRQLSVRAGGAGDAPQASAGS